MKTSASRHLRPLLTCLGLLFAVLTPTRAEEPAARTSPDEPLVIAKGKLTRDGKTVTAYLRNVLEVVRQRYPNINITVIGVDDVIIYDLTLQWGRYHGVTRSGMETDKLNPPLQSVLMALVEASGRKFDWAASSENDFLLKVPDNLRVKPDVSTEVFNLSPFFPHVARKRELERLLRDTEIQRGMMAKSQRPVPGSGEESPAERARIDDRIAALKEQLANVSKTTVDAAKLIEQIREVVEETLRLQGGNSVLHPRFQFHPGTNLLIVTGDDLGVDITRKVIAALEKNP